MKGILLKADVLVSPVAERGADGDVGCRLRLKKGNDGTTCGALKGGDVNPINKMADDEG